MSESFRLDPDAIYRCTALQQFPWQTHGFGTRAGNPEAAVTLRQVHSNRVVNGASLRDREEEGDALITDRIAMSIGIRTADCVPILLLDSKNRAIAAVHAGWRGTAARIVPAAIERMRADFATDPADLFAAIGPCIRSCCYEVGEDVAEHFETSGALQPASPGKYHLDLSLANRCQLQAVGVDPKRIFDSGLCTTCLTGQFFSFRREPANPGRMIASICRVA